MYLIFSWTTFGFAVTSSILDPKSTIPVDALSALQMHPIQNPHTSPTHDPLTYSHTPIRLLGNQRCICMYSLLVLPHR